MLAVAALVVLCIGQAERPPKLEFKDKIDYAEWCNNLALKSKDNGENALPLYAKLLKDANGKGGIPDIDEAVRTQLDACHGVWTETEYPKLAKFIKDNQDYLTAFTRATQVNRFDDPISPGTVPFEKLLPYLSPSRTCCRMVLARAWLKQARQAEAIAAAHHVILRAKNHVRQAGYLIGDLVGLAEGTIVYSSTREALQEDIISEADCSQWLHHLQDDDAPNRSWKDAILTEWASALAMIQRTCPNGKLDAEAMQWANKILGVEQPLTDKEIAVILRTDPRGSVTLLDSHFENLLAAIKGPLRWKTSDELKDLSEKFKSEASNSSDHLATIFTPNFARAYQISVRCESERRGTLLTLAIHAHHAKTGKWPADLAKIDASIGLKNAKAIRVDPMTGKRFIYRLKDGNPWLYSAGADGDDDGGTHHPKFGEDGAGGDFVFWPKPLK